VHVGDSDEVGVEIFRVLEHEAGVYYGGKGLGGQVARPFPFRGGEAGLGLVVLGELGLDVVVDACYLLRATLDLARAGRKGRAHLLQRVYQVGEGLVCAVLDLVPLEGAQILVHRL
jgi:hypothetical protein